MKLEVLSVNQRFRANTGGICPSYLHYVLIYIYCTLQVDEYWQRKIDFIEILKKSVSNL